MSDASDRGRRGRPAKTQPERRGPVIAARVTPGELAVIHGRAAGAGMTQSEFVRDMVLNGRVLVKEFKALSDIDRNDLARIGSNLNQIARVCNQAGDLRRAEALEIELANLRALLARTNELQ